LLALVVLAACADKKNVQTGNELSMTKSASPQTVQQAGEAIATGPLATVPPTPSLPFILVGSVTYCDSLERVMNLPFVDGFAPQDYKHDVTMNGLAVVCKVNTSNSKLLTCTYPAAVTFPVNIQVSINGMITNQFTFDGASCGAPIPPTEPVVKEPTAGPDPAPAPTPTCVPGTVCP
jgi:hypothetical protein